MYHYSFLAVHAPTCCLCCVWRATTRSPRQQVIEHSPAEGQKPLFIMSDSKFELMSIPDKFCLGEGGFAEQRPRKITYRKYFNARLQDVDGRFARDLDHLFVAQYIVECKQVLDDGNNFNYGFPSKGQSILKRACAPYNVLRSPILTHSKIIIGQAWANPTVEILPLTQCSNATIIDCKLRPRLNNRL